MNSKSSEYLTEEIGQSAMNLEEQFHLSDIGNSEHEPLLSVQAQHKPTGSGRSLIEDGRTRVHFSVGTSTKLEELILSG